MITEAEIVMNVQIDFAFTICFGFEGAFAEGFAS